MAARGRLWQVLIIRFLPWIGAGVVLGLLPALLPSYVQSIWTKFLVFAIFAASFDLIYGHAGLLSLGHAAFFGAGGYAVGALMLHTGITSF